MTKMIRLFLLIALTSGLGYAKDVEEKKINEANAVSYGEERARRLKVGVKITAGGPCKGIVVSLPVPMDWEEQQVKIVDEDISRAVRKFDYRVLENSVKQMVLHVPRLNSGEQAHAIVTFEVKGRTISGPKETDNLVIPKKIPRDLRKSLGASPYIESRNRKIQNAAKKVAREKEKAWEQAEAIYDFVRANVEYKESELKGAVQTLQEGEGDCEAMTSLFIAMCRAAKIPARMVWVTDHCYPEFYLTDEEGQGAWYPCQVAGTRAFGNMPDVRPIFQKGDNIKVPERKKGQRYASLFMKAASVRGTHPKVEEVIEFEASQ